MAVVFAFALALVSSDGAFGRKQGVVGNIVDIAKSPAGFGSRGGSGGGSSSATVTPWLCVAAISVRFPQEYETSFGGEADVKAFFEACRSRQGYSPPSELITGFKNGVFIHAPHALYA